MQSTRGFTLIELITVVVILGIVSAIGTSFVVSMVNSHRQVEQRSKLVSKGRTAIEQLNRQLRAALPNAVRISGTGNCIEFLPIVGGTNYISNVPDSENGAPAISGLATVPFFLGMGTAEHAVIGGLLPGDVFTSGSPAARVGINALGGGPIVNITFTGNHTFIRNSISRRVFITDNPKRFCLSGGNLVQYMDYGLILASLTDADPGGNSAIMAQGISTSTTAFSLSPGSEDRNTAVFIALDFAQGGEQISFNHQVLIRNVP